MYQFKYGVLPNEVQDRKYCQVKGDAGLYEVSAANEELVTISSGARTNEAHSLSKIRFLSAERIHQFESIMTQNESIDASIGKLVEVDELNNNQSLSIYSATMPFVGAAVMNLTDHYYVSTGSNKPVLVAMELHELCVKLNELIKISDSSSIESEINALALGLKLGGHYVFFDPLTSLKPTNVILRYVSANSIHYSTLKANKQFSDVEKSVPLRLRAAFSDLDART